MIDAFDSAVSLAERIRRREISSVELVSLCIERMDRYDGDLNAIIWRDDEQALKCAQAADARAAAGERLPAFHGVPIPVKDLHFAAGQPCTMGSLGIGDQPRDRSDLSVELLERAGFILLGRSNTPEMGPMSVTENRRFGVTRNPWDLDRSPAGSSGGAAAAVAAGLVPVAHASDGGGSIRMPASACGLVGLKPARGRVPQRFPAWEHGTTEGAITRHILDTAAVLDVMSVPDRTLFYHAPPNGRPYREEVGADPGRLRIGLMLDAPTGVPVEPQCAEAALVLARELEAQGHRIDPVSPRMFSFEAATAYVEVIVNASLYLTPYERPELAEPYLQRRRERAKDFHIGEYVQAAALIHEESREIVAQWGRDFDVLLTPTMATLPPEVGVVLAEANAQPDGLRLTETQMISFTSFCNLSGLPAITLPVHHAPNGLPVGAQLVGAPFDEATLIRLAASVEPTFGWTRRIPPAYR
jgi:amidase